MKPGFTILKNTSVLLLGRLLSLALGIIYVAALSRYIQAVGMGILATATSLVYMIGLLISFGLNDLTVRDIAADKSRAAAYVPNLFLLRGGLAALFLIVIFFVAKMANYPDETIVIIFIYAIAYLFDQLTDICVSVFGAYEKMEYSAALQTGRDIINIGLSLAAIALKFNLYVLVSISSIASLIKLLISLRVLRAKFIPILSQINLQLSRQLLLTALPFAALGFFNIISMQVDTFILSLYWPAQEVGWYSSANLIINYILLIPTIVLQAIFPVFSKLNTSSRDGLQHAYTISFKYLLLLGFALCTGTLVAAESVTSLIYGVGFEKTAVALRILGISFFWVFGFANGTLLITTGGQNLATVLSGIGMSMTIAMSLVLIPRWGLVGAGLAHILPGAVFFMPLIWFCHKKLDLQVPYLMGLKSIIAASLMAGAVTLALNNHVPVLIAILIVSPCVYGLALIGLGIIKRDDFEFTLNLFKTRHAKNSGEY